jgi:hypothetical protein
MTNSGERQKLKYFQLSAFSATVTYSFFNVLLTYYALSIAEISAFVNDYATFLARSPGGMTAEIQQAIFS